MASDASGPRSGGNALRRLVSCYGRAYAPRYGLAGLSTVLGQVPQRVPALVVGVALDAILLDATPYDLPLVPAGWIPGTTAGQVSFTIGLLAGAYLLDGGFSWFAGRIAGTAQLRTLHDVRVDAFDALLAHDVGYFDDRQTGDIMSVLNNDVGNVRSFANGFFEGLRFVVQILVAFALMLLLHPGLAGVLALMPLLLAGLSYWYANAVEPRYDAVRASVGEVNNRLEDSVEGIETVKSFAREDRERDAVAAASREYRDSKWSVIRLRLAYNLSSWTVASFAFIATFALGAYVVLNGAPTVLGGQLTAGTLLTFLLYAKSFYMPVRRLMLDVLDDYENALASAKRIVDVLDGADPARDDGRELTVTEGRIEYADVSFSYDGADGETLSDVRFTAEPGDLVGVVGPTGAGKSTLTKLLFRFYEPDSGTVRVDGTDVTEVTRRSLREHLGLVSQDPFLFYGTVRENIAYADPDADEDAVVAAAKRAGAHEFVTDLEDGYDTQVGERGASLSGGQRQRIAIARALLRDPEILVFDEATSHVDNETERHIQESVDALSGERTMLAVAHRLSTVRNADAILVVDDGAIVERGTHEELLDEDGLYADLWRVQVGETDAVSDEFFARADGSASADWPADGSDLADADEVVR